jgi:DNA-binding response OmpR family regulator
VIFFIGQSVLEEVLRENLKHINFEIKSFKKFNEIIQDLKVKNSSILVASLKDYDLFINSKLNMPVLFLNFGSKKSYTTSAEMINCPFQLNNFVERINVIFLKCKFLNNSNLNILNYEINLNSKEILRDEQKLKLTEREINFILFFSCGLFRFFGCAG